MSGGESYYTDYFGDASSNGVGKYRDCNWIDRNKVLKDTLTLPKDAPFGNYEALLDLPDKYSDIAQRPEYSIRLANKDVWEDSTGYNKLNATILVVK